MASNSPTWRIFRAKQALSWLLESSVRGNVQALFGGEGLGAPAYPYGVAQESSMWSVMLGVSGMRLGTAFPGV